MVAVQNHSEESDVYGLLIAFAQCEYNMKLNDVQKTYLDTCAAGKPQARTLAL